MTLHVLHHEPGPELSAALELFEMQFTYPLGASGHFRISHGRTYLTFFRAMGTPTVLVAEQAGEVLGTLAMVSRQVAVRTGGCTRVRHAHYLCDLKIRPTARGGRVLVQLMQEAKRQIESSGSSACYAVVMGGTGPLPTDYTGRIGIPGFAPLAVIRVLRLSLRAPENSTLSTRIVGTDEFRAVWQRLSPMGFRPVGGQSEVRSLMNPLPLVSRNGDACGLLEDTRRGKRLFDGDDKEIISAHLSSLAYANPSQAAEVLQFAVCLAASKGLSAVFAALPDKQAPPVLEYLQRLQILEAPATVFGYDLPAGLDWWIDTSEI